VSGPIVFISHNRIKPGKVEGLRGYAPTITDVIDHEKLGTVAFLTYIDDEGTEAHIVHVFPDAASMASHLEGLDDRASAAFEFIETTGYEIYGSPSQDVLEMMQGFANTLGVPLDVRPHHLAGYIRSAAG
jgi:hypothetical protein